MINQKLLIVFMCLFICFMVKIGICGSIIHPWNATSEIAKTGKSFSIYYNSDPGESLQSVELRGPYNSVNINSITIEKGSWEYDKMSGATYNTRVSVAIPFSSPEELYDLVINSSSGSFTSKSSVKVIREYRKNFTFFQISDLHMAKEKTDGYPSELLKLKFLIDVANIVSPEIVFITGDLVNANKRNLFPEDEERWDFYYRGHKPQDLPGVYDIQAPVFSIPGNHDFEEGLIPFDGNCPRKADFWNKYNGIQGHHFEYGDTRFMMLSNAWGGCSQLEQKNDHNNWLDQVGNGNLRVLAQHIYLHNGSDPEWAIENNIQMGLAGHNHNIGPDSPFRQGNTDMYISNYIHHMTFSVFRVDSFMNVEYLHNKVAVENPYEDPSTYIPRLSLNFKNQNNGRIVDNTATIKNNLEIGFPRARVRFVMPLGKYKVSGGEIDQIITNDSLTVVDVRTVVDALGTKVVSITPDLTPIKFSELHRPLKIKTKVFPEKIQVHFKALQNFLIRVKIFGMKGKCLGESITTPLNTEDPNIEINFKDKGLDPGNLYFLKLEASQGGLSNPISKVIRFMVPL